MRERDGARRQASVQVDGAKRLWRSRCHWERDTCERVARGRGRPEVGARGPEDQTILVAAQKAGGFSMRLVI